MNWPVMVAGTIAQTEDSRTDDVEMVPSITTIFTQ